MSCGVIEIVLFSALVLVTRCANVADVFVDGRIYFVDADCYSRMTRARLVAEHPGTVVRQHDFENYPAGVRPHTTAPLDYLIVLLAATLHPFTAQSLDLAGAILSPLLALGGGCFLWWWSRRFAAPARLLMLLVYGLSGILVHGTALGRPDQQALLIVLLLVALVAEHQLREAPSQPWSVVSGLSWGLAFWVSLYEPLILLLALFFLSRVVGGTRIAVPARRIGWWILLAVLLLAALVERRLPEWPAASPFLANWSATIGELRGLSLTNPGWLYWTSGLLLVSPLLLGLALRRRSIDPLWPGLVLLFGLLTFWQARWGYYFTVVFLLTLPAQLAVVRQRWLVWCAVALALMPFLQFWDARLWPDETVAARQNQDRREMIEWRAAASSLAGSNRAPILAPWWLAPATAYWSGQPVVAGSSHESLPGIVDTARFFLATAPEEAADLLRRHGVKWVLMADGDRVLANAAAILARPVPEATLGRILDRTPSQAPSFLALVGQNDACKVYQVRDLR
ncbi:MAG: hypothetical protein ABI540_03915 [Spartobacteria bacterium]